MKKFFIAVVFVLIFFMLPVKSFASFSYSEIFDAIPDNAKNLLGNFGIDENVTESFSFISPTRAVETVISLFTDGFSEVLSTGALCIALVLISVFLGGLIPDKSSIFFMGKAISVMMIIYFIAENTAEIFSQCCSSLLVTKDFMLVLIPVFTGIVSFSGNPSLALSFNSVVFSFSELIAILFERIVPTLSAVLMGVCTAGAINPFMKTEGFTRLLNKAVTLFMAFIAGIFVAVLSVRGVIAGAADSVTIRGVRFLIGNTIPVVGSAIGEALNSVVAGISLIKNTAGMLGIAGVIAINIPCLINMILWKGMLYVTSVTADITGSSEIKSLSDNMNGVLSVIAGALCFVSFVFIISIAIIITISRS